MYEEDQLIEQLGIGHLTKEQQTELLEQLNYRIGLKISEGYSEQQLNEYQAIINDNQDVINAWLSQHAPEYKESPIYQEILTGYHDDPEHVNPSKVFASIAWTQLNSPNAQDVIAEVLDEFKQELSHKNLGA